MGKAGVVFSYCIEVRLYSIGVYCWLLYAKTAEVAEGCRKHMSSVICAMVMNATATGIHRLSPANSPTTATTTTAGSKASLRRRRSKGTIAGYASSAPHDGLSLKSSPPLPKQQSADSLLEPEISTRPCPSAQVVLLCVQNALCMGARTRLSLTPPGRARQLLQSELRNRGGSHVDVSNLPGLEQMVDLSAYDSLEQDFLMNTNTFSIESDEDEASSGDEEELPDYLDASINYTQLSEPLYISNDAAAAAAGAAGPATPPGGAAMVSKLPFCRRKLRYFDRINSVHRTTARNWLKIESTRVKRLALARVQQHLAALQERETEVRVEEDVVTRFPQQMTPEIAAALVLESLALNKMESIEGMSKCYDGIVAAGVAVLEAMDLTAVQPDKARPTREQIMAALTPLLITSLEPLSGEVIVRLAQLRKMCGTLRYQRRFCQRIAPALVRPASASPWSLRQQNDMEAIVAATELLLDQAPHVFAKGWYERGGLLLADNKRAETLNYAAQQLRELSSETPSSLLLGGGKHRRKAAEPLLEWEVMAVDFQIRTTLATALKSDWSRSAITRQPPLKRKRETTATSRVALSHSPIPNSPRSPTRKSPQPQPPPKSPPQMPDTSIEQVFGPAFATQPIETVAKNPDTTLTPPRSPKSPTREKEVLSPVRGTIKEVVVGTGQTQPSPTTPLSPSSVGSISGSTEVISYKPTTTNTSSGGPAHYRMLTSTAAERKRTVAACRALRAQISRFEDAFVQLHGRAPKGAAERAPLATTYAQYREWKRAIRADAACRIQALLRGFWARTLLLRSGRPEVVRVVTRRRPPAADLQLPDNGMLEGSGSSPSSNSSVSQSGPQWRTRVRPRNSSPVPSPRSGPPSPLGGGIETTNLSLAELQAQKRDLKNRLKQYDMSFARQHGRMPVKAEKEPIRNLYESYNALKTQIVTLEQRQRRQPIAGVPQNRIAPVAPIPARSISPTSGSDTSGQDDQGLGNPPPAARSRRKVPSASQDLQALKLEKGTLHQMLRKYEKEFFREHRRQVSSFTDIRPVASQYRRYKEIKKLIANLQRNRRQG